MSLLLLLFLLSDLQHERIEKEEVMLGLTPLGTFHTAISLIAVVAGLVAFVRDKEISPKNLFRQIYVIATVIT